MAMDVGGNRTVKSDINVVPLVDVCLVLLVIFMVVTPLLQKGVDVKLPEAAYAAKKPEVKVTLTVKKDGTIFVEMDQVPKANLESKLKELFEARVEKTLYMKADTTLNYQAIMDIMDICQQAGIESVGLMTEKKAAGGQ